MICPKCCWKSETVAAQLSSVKLRFCKTSQISQKTSRMEFLLRETISSQACNCTKKWHYHWHFPANIFMWIHFLICTCSFRKDKSNNWRGSVKKCILKNFANFTVKRLCWSLFLVKLQVFKNTYFEEHLWMTASKKIDICLIVKVISHRRAKLLNSDVNKKNSMCENFTSEVMWNKNCRR